MQNLQMTMAESYEEDESINITLRSRMMTGTNKSKQFEQEGWVWKVLEKEVDFDLDHTKETFMESRKSFTEASAPWCKEKV